jgi:metal-responsive CopG/Arc/MetJ family transcriptional regulator
MKTAVSLPDELFQRAESAARKLRVSRSRLYALAIGEYLDRRRADRITRRLDEVYAQRSSRLDPALRQAQFKSLGTETW